MSIGVDLLAMMAVLEQAHVVNRKMESDPALAALSFRDGWNVCVGEYASAYAERPA